MLVIDGGELKKGTKWTQWVQTQPGTEPASLTGVRCWITSVIIAIISKAVYWIYNFVL